MIGIFCVDPGGHTGVAWAVVDETSRTVKEAMRSRRSRGSKTLIGSEREQILDLYETWILFHRRCQGPKGIETQLVVEDFVLRPGPHAGGRDGTMPERIAWGFEGYRMASGEDDIPIIWQQPGAAAQFGKLRSRMEEWEAWIVGKEHERSAHRHMAVRVAALIT